MRVRQVYVTNNTRTRVAFCSAGNAKEAYMVKLAFTTVEDTSKSIVFELYYDDVTKRYIDKKDNNTYAIIFKVSEYDVIRLHHKRQSSYVTTDYAIHDNELISVTIDNDPMLTVNNTTYTANAKGLFFEYHHSNFIDNEGNLTDVPQTNTTYVKEIEAVRQFLLQHLSVMKHELWYNYEYGLPLMQDKLTKAMIDSEIALIISECRYIDSVTKFESYIDEKHTYHLSFEVMTLYGKLEMIDTL